jgi:hypothetical protein
MPVGEIVDAIERHGRGDRGVQVLETRLQPAVVCRQRNQRSEVTARRTSSDGDKGRIATVL